MTWLAFGYCLIAAMAIAGVAAICAFGIRVLLRRSTAFLLVFTAASSLITITAQKTNGVNNLPPQQMMPRPMAGVLTPRLDQLQLRGDVGPSVAPDDIARGWRVESVTTNESFSYEMPTDAALVGNWHVHGASSSYGNNRIDFGGWRFPLGTNGAAFSSFWHFVDGRIRPTPKDAAHEICAVGVPMSAVPEQSRLWRLDGDDGSRTLTWENFFFGGNTNCPVNAQIVLCPNGDFAVRSNGVETVCRRVNPDDWDDDGIENAIDPNPLFCDGDFFGPANVLPEGANSNAYCTVSLVVDGPDALVVFQGDGPSNYPDPRFVARRGVTNDVFILIGKTYTVSSDWPVEIVGSSDPDTEVTSLRGPGKRVRRPVSISAGDGNPFDMYVTPSDMGGVFSWMPTGCGCTLSGSGTTFSWSCSTNCTCCGTGADGTYAYEGYWLPATSCLCGCHYDGEGPTWTDDGEDPDNPGPFAASVSAAFTKSAVIFEDAYENLPGQWVGKRSNRMRLNLVAHGGPNGAALSVSATNLGKLSHISGPDLPLASVALPANTSVSYAIVYEGSEASGAADDISVTATLTENVTGSLSSDSCSATSVRLEMSPVWAAPENPCTNRHVYGVGEKVRFNVQPQLSSVVLSTVKQDTQDAETSEYELFGTNVTVDASVERIYTCPISANYVPPVKVTRGDVEYSPLISLVEPQEVITRGAEWGVNKVDLFSEDKRRCWLSGSVGTATLVTTNYIGPMTVSFRGIAVSELECDEEDTITGCLTNVMWRTHTSGAGAGKAYPITNGNFWFIDAAGLTPEIANWEPGGELVLRIPIGWHRRKSFASDEQFDIYRPDYETWGDYESRALIVDRQYTQRFTVDGNGVCKTEKFGHWISRSRYCRVILDGRTLQWSHPLW